MAIKKRNKIGVEFSMASMTDIVFLLLIFFMITSTLVSPNALKLLLPKSSSKTLAKQNITISITKDLQYFVNKQPTSIDNIEQTLKEKLANETEPTIVLQVEQTVPIEHVVEILDIANRNKYKAILATSPK